MFPAKCEEMLSGVLLEFNLEELGKKAAKFTAEMISCQCDVSSLAILRLDKLNKNNKCALSPDFISLANFYMEEK